jgi:hypothetical protein
MIDGFLSKKLTLLRTTYTDYYESPDQGHFDGDYYKETFPELLDPISCDWWGYRRVNGSISLTKSRGERRSLSSAWSNRRYMFTPLKNF